MEIASKIKVDCAGEPEMPIPKEIFRNLNISYQEAFSKAEAMTEIAKILRKSDVFCRLPFCVTTEAEAFGAEVIFNENAPAPFVSGNHCRKISEIDSIPEIDLSAGRIAEVLKAVAKLNAENEQVILNVEGPLTILGLLAGSRNLYKGLLRTPDKIQELCEQITENLLLYLQEAVRQGIKMISYADPTVAYDVISDQLYRNVCGKITYDFLKKYQTAKIPCPVHLCNRTSVGFAASGFCIPIPVVVPEGITYTEALQYVIKYYPNVHIIGHGCLLQSDKKMKVNHIFQIKLADSL